MPVTRPAQLLRERGARPALTCGAAPSCQGSWRPGRQSPCGRSTQGSPTQPRPAFSLRAPPRHTSKPHKPLEGGVPHTEELSALPRSDDGEASTRTRSGPNASVPGRRALPEAAR